MSASSWEALPPVAQGERALRRSLGPTAWAVLTDLCLDAEPAGAGAHVVATSARRVGAHLGITKDTAARALRRLIAAGVVRRRPQGAGVAGRFTSGSYELQPPTMTTSVPGNDGGVGASPTAASFRGRATPGRGGYCERSMSETSVLPQMSGMAARSRRR